MLYFDKFAVIIFTFTTIAIASMDLGLPYNQNEIYLYQHPAFQVLSVISGIYLNVKDFTTGFTVFSLWVLIKFFKFSKLELK